MEAGTGNITISGGNGTDAMTFDMTFDEIPTVVVTLAEDPGAGKVGLLWVHTITTIGFTAELDSDSGSSDIDYNWIAMERRSFEKSAQ